MSGNTFASGAAWRGALVTVGFAIAAGCAEHERASRAEPQARTASHEITARETSAVKSGTPLSAAKPAQVGSYEVVAEFNGAMPTGVTVSRGGRVFVNFPRWGDVVPFTVAELRDGKAVAFPDEAINTYDPAHVAERLVSVQSVVVDPDDRLWMLDTGSVQFGPVVERGPKMVAVDLRTNRVTKTIAFPPDVALKTTYLNDVRFDLRRGQGGFAYITDSGGEGPNGIVVVDLGSGRSWRKLTGDRTVRAEENFTPVVEGQPLVQRPQPGVSKRMAMGSDGIALSADGKRLFYTPLIGHHLYSVSTDALANEQASDEEVRQTIVDHGDRGYASDGLECDAAGTLYLTDYEHNAVHQGGSPPDQILVQDPKLLWPDTMSISNDGYLYFTANQLNRQKLFHEGKDLRQKPYLLVRTKIDGKPVALK